MAVDTQSKRRAVNQLAPLCLKPVPSGSSSHASRKQASNLYPEVPAVLSHLQNFQSFISLRVSDFKYV